MSFSTADPSNFDAKVQSAVANSVSNENNRGTDRSATGGYDNGRSYQGTNQTGPLSSGLGRSNERSTGTGFEDTGSFAQEQSGRSYGNTRTGEVDRSAGTAFDNSNLDRSTGSGFDTTDRSSNMHPGIGTRSATAGNAGHATTGGLGNTGNLASEESGRYGNEASGDFGRGSINTSTSDPGHRESSLRDTVESSTRGPSTRTRGFDSDAPNTQPHDAGKGTTGVIASTFGAENTTTSTFEKSQGESFGHGFQQSGQKPRNEMSIDEGRGNAANQAGTGAAAGGSGYNAGQSQETRHHTEGTTEHSTGSHKEGLAHKLMDKAEGLFHHHGHKGETTENRTGGGY